jgi:hypothetical protein
MKKLKIPDFKEDKSLDDDDRNDLQHNYLCDNKFGCADDKWGIVKDMDKMLKPFGLEILYYKQYDNYPWYKIVSRNVLTATKNHLEKGVPFG